MNQLTAHKREYTRNRGDLYLAFELGSKEWKLGFSVGFGQRPRERTVSAGDLAGVRREIERAKRRFGLSDEARVLSCYEAGRDGFWLHRYLVHVAVKNLVVDSSSIEVNRRARRAKTDKMDLGKLVSMLMRYDHGERKLWSVVRVPTVEQEDSRQLHRELKALRGERTRHINRIKGLLASYGVRMRVGRGFLDRLETKRLWDGRPLPLGLKKRLVREYERLEMVKGQIKQVEAERADLVKTSESPDVEKVRQLLELRGIGINSAWLYVMEFFGWREFRNRREVGALAGLTPTPHQSGDEAWERGISKAGNRYIRSMAIQIAWAWLR
ncbi:MAG: IS110 family transposase, partial [Gammaproteobacteria bacterium]|nr:IS110 family transposase [Deltaproteobacteria bacterium]NIW09789.1 IS110 family transposase [Gammaproteobacteria bacterium]